MTKKSMKQAPSASYATPGDLLWFEFLEPLEISRYRLAKEIGVPAQRIGDIIAGKRSITADTDLRLSKYFGLSQGYWLRAQAAHDLTVTKSRIEKELESIVPFHSAERSGTSS
jgi:addiction module HigA family antidote